MPAKRKRNQRVEVPLSTTSQYVFCPEVAPQIGGSLSETKESAAAPLTQASGSAIAPEERRGFKIEVLEVVESPKREVDYEKLFDRFDCIELALALCLAERMGSLPCQSDCSFHFSADANEWNQVMTWLDSNLESYRIRFYPMLTNEDVDERYPVFWIKKKANDQNGSYSIFRKQK